jgi:hypothetical protein
MLYLNVTSFRGNTGASTSHSEALVGFLVHALKMRALDRAQLGSLSVSHRAFMYGQRLERFQEVPQRRRSLASARHAPRNLPNQDTYPLNISDGEV